jgi:two-component system chemotaxis response regulator CheB
MAESRINKHYEIIVIGGSAGSLEVIMQLLPAFRSDLQVAIVIVVHRKNTESLLVEVLTSKTNWPVREVEDKENIVAGTIYIAPADYHLLIEKDRSFSLDDSEKIHYSRPALDVTFETAAEAYRTSMAAILLSGANADGTQGLEKAKEYGALTIVQQPEDAMVAYMPLNAIRTMKADYIASTMEIISIVNELK